MNSKKPKKLKKIKMKIFYIKQLPKLFRFSKINENSKVKFYNKKQFKKICLLFFIIFIISISFNISIKRRKISPFKTTKVSNDINNEGFLIINTTHKGKYNKYNYKENIIIYKDLYNNISYTPITEFNSIIKSEQISNETYFELCKNKSLLDNTKYKRNSKPKISVIIPFYNKNKFSIYIPLRAIQNQSLKDLEIICVDDGSTQEVIDQIIEEIKNDNRIILLKHKENKGTLMSRVDGVRYASGEYILNLDQDDLYTDNLFLENIYKKIKELNVDILQFFAMNYANKNINFKLEVKMPINKIITQPELKISFLQKKGVNRLGGCATRMIWDKFVKTEVYKKAIEDLGDEYLNHRVFLYEDTLMMFELSQVANSYYFYDILGYRLNLYNQGQSRDHTSDNIRILAMNQLNFIKLLLYKIPPIYDRYHIFKEWGLHYCGSEAYYLDKIDFDLLLEVLEVIYEIERVYRNTCRELLRCTRKIKRRFHLL